MVLAVCSQKLSAVVSSMPSRASSLPCISRSVAAT